MTTDRATNLQACPSGEWLTAYLTTDLSVEESQRIDSHARGCDNCARLLQTASARLRIAPEVAVALPFELRQRVAPREVAQRRESHRPAWRDLLERFTELLRPSALVPLAAAAILLLVIRTQLHDNDSVRSLPPLEQTTLRIGATQALVRTQPTTRAEVIATLERGTAVTYRGEDRDWYRVTMPNGTEGWIERDVFDR